MRDDKVLRIYTDGGCAGNQNEENLGGWGAVLEYAGNTKELHGAEANTTNNRMEMTALLEAFRAIRKEAQTIQVFSDSSYLMDCFRKGWYKNWQANGWKTAKKQPVENQDLWKELLPFLEHHDISFFRVKGHVNLNSEQTDFDKLYEKFCQWNGDEFTFEDFKYVTEKNNRADALANEGIDSLRGGACAGDGDGQEDGASESADSGEAGASEAPEDIDYYAESLKLHEEYKGKWEMRSKVPIATLKDLSLAYTPGVAQPCLEIAERPEDAYKYTSKWNTVAIATDGSAALGLGNIGGMAALPIMEGKAVLFKQFADIDAVPICLETQDIDEIVMILKNIAPTFGGINLEDISAPRCFEIERKLQEQLDIPVFHDDQHGTAIVVTAGIINGCRLLDKKMEDLQIAISGAGAAGTAIAEMLMDFGVKDIVLCDSKGILGPGRDDLNPEKKALAEKTNSAGLSGGLAEAIEGRDVFVGVSKPGIVSKDMIKSMKKDPIVFAMSNPEPEITPEDAIDAGAAVVGTGRSDYANQVNNLLAFPGVFRGALDARAKKITHEMKKAAAVAIAESLEGGSMRADYVIPTIFDRSVGENVARAVAQAWKDE